MAFYQTEGRMRIVRFENDGGIHHGVAADDRHGAWRIEGDLFGGYEVTQDLLVIERLLAPVTPTDILCIGLNYGKHAAETRSELPKVPMLFIKSSGTLNHPGAEVVLPAVSGSVDWEAELCVVIGRTCKNVSAATALDYVFGYTCANDVSARDWQKDRALGGGQFARGKSFDGFCPIGPWIVTKDALPDPNALAVRCLINDQVMQEGTTADMIFPVAEVIASLSRTMTLRPGAVILTGTPDGVGAGRIPPVWLKDGDRVVVEIDRIGRLENRFVNEPA